MISTVQGLLLDENTGLDVLMDAFPMGSMTGAPKTQVMKHILDYENQERGFYSGCIGYLDPKGNFDFNVCIRTSIYNAKQKEISYNVGSAITYDSCPEEEYEECLIKGSRMLSVFKKD